jgi:hypothetical protein
MANKLPQLALIASLGDPHWKEERELADDPI